MELPNSRVGAELRARKAARQSGENPIIMVRASTHSCRPLFYLWCWFHKSFANALNNLPAGPEVEKNLGEVLDLSTPQANTAYDDLGQKNRTS